MPLINGVRLGAKMRQHVMTTPRGAFVTQGGDVDRRDDDAFAWSGGCFRE